MTSDLTIPSDQDIMLARAALLKLEQNETLRIQISAADQKITTLDLPSLITRLLLYILEETAAGNALMVVPVKAKNAPRDEP